MFICIEPPTETVPPCGALHNKKVMLGDDADSQLLARIVSLKEGLVLIAGPTGSGKSFTLAGYVQYVNENFARHIVTLEDY